MGNIFVLQKIISCNYGTFPVQDISILGMYIEAAFLAYILEL